MLKFVKVFMICLICWLQFMKMGWSQNQRIAAGQYSIYNGAFDHFNSPMRSAQENVYYPIFGDECTSDLVTLRIDGQWGKISGMNGFMDLEKAQKLSFSRSENFRLVGAMVWFEKPSVIGDGTMNCKVYLPDSENGTPDRLVGFSQAIKVSDINFSDTLPMPTYFDFEQGAPVMLDHPDFFISVDFRNLYQSFDTVSLLQTIDGCGDGGDSWELFANGETWSTIAADNSWQINADFVVAAVVDFDSTNSTQSFIRYGNITLFSPYPNPARENFLLNYSIDNPTHITMELFTIDGKLIRSMNLPSHISGPQKQEISTKGLPSGQFICLLRTDRELVSSRIVID